MYAAAWMMIPQAVAVAVGAFTIMVKGGQLDAMAITGTGTILVAWVDGRRLTDDPLKIAWALVDEADDRMYMAKRAGRNRVTLPT